MTIRFLVCCITLLASRAASAHDFWIEPSTFRPAVGANMTVALRVGQGFVGDAVPRSAQLMDTFVIRDTTGERAIDGFENQDPAGMLSIGKPGLAIIGYRSKPYPVVLAADKFEEFLKSEGLERISALRKERGESEKPDREYFFRYAKAMVVAGSGSAGRFDEPLHYRYELIPETNPTASTSLRVRVLFEEKPLANALVTAIHRDDPAAHISARSDANGRVTLALPKSGVWLIKSVQMVAAPAGSSADWESLWASLTFER